MTWSSCILGALVVGLAQNTTRAEDPVRAMLSVPNKYRVVMLGELHRSIEFHQFLQRLIEDPHFPDRYTDIAVEFGTAHFQSTADAYVNGKQVSDEELAKIWRNTGQWTTWDAPMYRYFFELMRKVNSSLPEKRRVRVVLGDPDLDWTKIKTAKDYEPFALREPDFAKVLEREVIAHPERRALVVIGGMHVTRMREQNKPLSRQNLTLILDDSRPGLTYSVFCYVGQPAEGTCSQDQQCFVDVQSGAVSEMKFSKFCKFSSVMKMVDGKWVEFKPDPATIPTAKEAVDAVLYLGPESHEAGSDGSACRDREYRKLLEKKAVILSEVYGLDFHKELQDELAPCGGARPTGNGVPAEVHLP
ncbi:MAG TPA: ChaN family lipoprotein [Phycisphaerae bacterium]|nr:ChaN family lipoprotein [Phycisphaerae bacterium]